MDFIKHPELGPTKEERHIYKSMKNMSHENLKKFTTRCKVSGFPKNPPSLSCQKNYFRYLKGTTIISHCILRFSIGASSYTDSDYAGATLDRKSTTGAEYVAADQLLWDKFL
ncbi:hypothetical protein Tco_0794958 [Tanacetum coccineum]